MHAIGLAFSSDSRSANFARTLELVMWHENAFAKLPDQQGLIQIDPPTQEEQSAAARWMDVAFNQEGPVPAQQHVSVIAQGDDQSKRGLHCLTS